MAPRRNQSTNSTVDQGAGPGHTHRAMETAQNLTIIIID